jgi:hypothetical protein
MKPIYEENSRGKLIRRTDKSRGTLEIKRKIFPCIDQVSYPERGQIIDIIYSELFQITSL